MIIGISGMISSGKSTLTTNLVKKFDNSEMLLEFNENDEVFNTFLRWFYEQKENLTIGFQTYIIENHSSIFVKKISEFHEKNKKNKVKGHFFLDRFSLEHYIFAKINLAHKEEKYMRAYDLAFKELITESELPDLAIFLDLNFETFKKRFFKRDRSVETDNWEKNKNYFETLYKNYKSIFIQLCKDYNLKYEIIDTNNLTEEQVQKEAEKIINYYASKNETNN
ncbi:deoxynucleoside kinase [Mesomycoplasma lagogenitalium]|uniref:Deoxynucleoside kinase n=1 Tax=Mesomycoplasma lagogenitalium TaxID=171286 RepID=A0ABY8LUN6_9BACT|nr:deoxynucleoside kinase [Mesomycoplasma lagogenitalium]WGI36953.1 deoxynucleoside kinase [Mesomycoplasma lagogenitalium]